METKTKLLENEICFGFKIFHILCTIFGLASYPFYEENKYANKINRCRRIVTALIWILMYSAVIICTMMSLSYSSKISKKVIISYTISHVLICLTSIVSIYAAFTKKYPSIYQTLSEVDVSGFSSEYLIRTQKSWKIARTFEITLILIVTIIMSSYVLLSYQFTSFWEFGRIVLLFLSDFCNTLLTCQYIICIALVKEKHYFMNQFISSHIIYNRSINRNTQDINVPPTFGDISNTSFLSTYIARNLHKLRISHDQIYDIVSSINRNYGLSILFVVCWKLVSVVASVYYVIHHNDISYKDIIYCIHTSVILVRLPMLCHSAMNEFQNSKVLVQKLILYNAYGSMVNKELKLLSSQLNSIKIEYTAYGFFVLNLPFLSSVVSVILSYILILIQFKEV